MNWETNQNPPRDGTKILVSSGKLEDSMLVSWKSGRWTNETGHERALPKKYIFLILPELPILLPNGQYATMDEWNEFIASKGASNKKFVDRDGILDTPVKNLYLSVRTHNCLSNEGIVTLRELVSFKEVELLRIPNFGRKSLRELKILLGEYGLTLGMSVDLNKEETERFFKRSEPSLFGKYGPKVVDMQKHGFTNEQIITAIGVIGKSYSGADYTLGNMDIERMIRHQKTFETAMSKFDA